MAVAHVTALTFVADEKSNQINEEKVWSRAGLRPGQTEGEATSPGSVSDTGAKLSSKAWCKHHARSPDKLPQDDIFLHVHACVNNI